MRARNAFGFLLASAALVLAGVSQCAAEPFRIKPITDYINATVKPWIGNSEIIATLKRRNADHAALTQAEIDALDIEWRAEIESGNRPAIVAMLNDPVSRFLQAQRAASGGVITEIILMDNRGLNAALSDPTSDEWQGDEDKFRKSFGAGPQGFFIGEPEKDDSTQLLQSQASMTVLDETGQPIGAITIGINLDAL